MSPMMTLVLRRIAMLLVSLLLVSLAVFTISALLPGDAAEEVLGQNATPDALAALRISFGLDQPAPVRYWHWLLGLMRFDPGSSMTMDMPIADVIGDRLWKSLVLAGLSAAFAIPVSLAIGVVSAVHRDGGLDRALSYVTLVMISVPEFLVATVAVIIFSVELGWLPSLVLMPAEPTPWEFLRGYALPVVTLSFAVIAQMARMTRAAIVEELSRPYVEMARLKGISGRRLITRHILPNAIGPIAIAIAFSLSTLLSSTIIVETIFSYPGLASLMVNAVTSRDTPLLQACAMIFSLIYLLLVLAADIVAIMANPRLKR